MTTITVEVPDELAGQLRPLRNQLPRLLSFIVQVFPVEPSFVPLDSIASHPAKEMLDFLISRPTPEQILTFKSSPAVQTRLETLLDKNREENLNEDEMLELEWFDKRRGDLGYGERGKCFVFIRGGKFMKTLTVPINEFDFVKFGFESDTISFAELQKKISLAYAKEALARCHKIAQDTGLSEITLQEINVEIQAVRTHAKDYS